MSPRLAWLYAARPIRYYRSLAAHGYTVRTWTPFGRGIVTGDPDIVRELFATPTMQPMTGLRLEDFFGASSPVVLGGAEHAATRRRLRRPMANVDDVARIAAEETEREVETWPLDRTFALLPALRRITLRVILRALGGEHALMLEEAATRWVETITPALAALPALRQRLAGLGPWDRHLRARDNLQEALLQLITQRERQADGADILSGLLATTDEAGQGMTDRWILDQLLSLIFAGHETSAVTLAWTLAWLLRDPKVLARATAEARHGIEATYLDACITEAMRNSPLGDLPARVAAEDMRVGGVDVRRGEAVIVAPWILHHRPDLWPEPDVYRPERHIDRQADPSILVPFGGGVRRCIGAQLARQELPAVLATVLASTRLDLMRVPRARRIGLVIGPGDGVRVTRR